MTRSHTKSLGTGFAILAAALIAALITVSAVALPASAEPVADACDNPSITANQAERIAVSLMREYGYTSRKVSPWAFLIRETRCIDGRWTVSVDVRQGNWIQKRAYIRIDCTTGAAEVV